MTAGKRLALFSAVGTAGFVVAVLVAGGAHGLALSAFLLFVTAIAVTVAARRVGAEVTSQPLGRMLLPPPRPDTRIPQLDTLLRQVRGAESTVSDLHYRLRPLVREIAAARLARGYGIDLTTESERARTVVGMHVWELARPDRPAPEERFVRGWPRRDLESLVDELEQI